MSHGANNPSLVPRNSRSGSHSEAYVQINVWNGSSAAPRPPLPPYRPSEGSGHGQNRWSFFEDSYSLDSFPRPSTPIQMIVLDNETVQEGNPRHRQFIRESHPRIQDEEESALKKLKKQVYNPNPKSKIKKWNLYYRDNASKSSNTTEEEKDEDGKGCAICLEDFVPKQEVLVTPCNHMFHEDCIVPWVTSHDQCPVCRFVLGKRRRERRENPPNDAYDLIDDLLTLSRAMTQANPWLSIIPNVRRGSQ